MGQLAGRPQADETALAGTSQQLFIGECESCGAPVTIVAAHKPEALRCQTCTDADR